MPTWVIIGASRGIGYQFLKTLSRDPSNIVVGTARTVDVTKEKVAADGLKNVHIIHGDLDDSASLYAAAKEVSSIANGVVDYLIINGAYFALQVLSLKPGDFVGAEKEALLISEINQSMRTNVIGPLFATNAFMPLLLKSDVKKVVNISSGAGEPDVQVAAQLTEQVPYGMSKAALNILTAKFAAQYYDQGVKFLSLSPGFVLTMADDINNLPPELAPVFNGFMEKFKRLKPDFTGPISTEESVDLQLKVIHDLTLEQSGQFLSHHGNKEWV